MRELFSENRLPFQQIFANFRDSDKTALTTDDDEIVNVLRLSDRPDSFAELRNVLLGADERV